MSTLIGHPSNPLPPVLQSHAGQLFLSIEVNGDSEMWPRMEVGAAPFAHVAVDATGDINPQSVSVGGQTVIDENGPPLIWRRSTWWSACSVSHSGRQSPSASIAAKNAGLSA